MRDYIGHTPYEYGELREEDPRTRCLECLGLDGDHHPGCPYENQSDDDETGDTNG